MSRKLLLGIGIPVLLLGLIALGTYVWIRTPVETQGYEDPVSADQTEQNTALAAALRAGGIDDAFVDVGPEQAYVAYDPPADSASSDSDWQWFVLGAAADAVSGTERVVAVLYDGETPTLSWSVPLDELQAFAAGEMDADAFQAHIDKQAL